MSRWRKSISRRVGALICATLLLSATPASATGSDFERQVLQALNAARTNPAATAAILRNYRNRFQGNFVSFPGNAMRLRTEEGVTPVDEAIQYLARQRSLPPLLSARFLADGAAKHVSDQGRRGLIGHVGSDGSSPSDRLARHDSRRPIAEVIQYGANQPLDVIRQLIVDDGVAGRGHRRILFDPKLHAAGVACGPHRDYRTMCVIDFESGVPETDSPAGMTLQASR